VSRELFWLGYPLALIYFLFGPSLILISIFGLGPSEPPWAEASIFLAAALPAVWIGGAIGAKRFHDRGKSGWLMIIFGAGPILSIGAAYTLAELIIPKYGLPEVFEPIQGGFGLSGVDCGFAKSAGWLVTELLQPVRRQP
jgi:uncharacterized membrane protein YhaH (DUF805 family)